MNDLLVLVGVFLGGATPWLEAVVVIPGGILAGVHPVPVVMVGVAGNVLTVALAAVFGERIRDWWRQRRAREEMDIEPGPRSSRGERVLKRYGLPVLALLGPIAIGTQVSAIVAVGMGIDRRTAFLWVAAATLVWAIIAAVATVAGVDFFIG